MRGRVRLAIMYPEYGLSSIHATIFQNRTDDRANLRPNPRNAITDAINRCSVKVPAIYERPIKSGISRVIGGGGIEKEEVQEEEAQEGTEEGKRITLGRLITGKKPSDITTLGTT